MNNTDKITELANKLKLYSFHYYNGDAVISDEKYDILFKKLQELEKASNTETEYSNTVGTKSLGKKIKHKTPMLSLNNAFFNKNIDDKLLQHAELLKFNERVEKEIGATEYVASPKYDGIAISLYYKNGILNHAGTRGDGLVGEDVTHNISLIKNIPYKISLDEIDIRGELIFYKEDFLEFNKINRNIYSNPRNLIAGTIRQEKQDTKLIPIYFFAYSAVNAPVNNYADELDFLISLGFTVSSKCELVTDIIDFYHKIEGIRATLPFAIDGVVYKVNSYLQQEELGYTGRAPKFAIAYKFSPEYHQATIIDIECQVGRTGVITPVAKISPVTIDGININSATLHNFQEIKRKDIRIGDMVLVYRAGDVIPAILENIPELRPSEIPEFIPPVFCPKCYSLLINELKDIYCPAGKLCIAQQIESIIHFVSKSGMNVVGFSIKTIEKLVETKVISDMFDIFYLTEASLKIPRLGTKSISNILNAINKSKNTTLERLIYALGIKHVGEETAQILAYHFTLMSLFKADILELTSIQNIGLAVARSIVNFFSAYDVLEKVEKSGIVFYKESIKESIFTKKHIVITGIFHEYKRHELEVLLKKQGAYISQTVNKTTDILLCADETTTKYAKAIKLMVKIINENELKLLLI